ncbi:MAG: hypothetical protein L3V56_05020 [Candidatus Magnetoovum sp. WYHC-5]|nr:hypothetical protein [Candidatus Magnetoovum sp. WYHC-5]
MLHLYIKNKRCLQLLVFLPVILMLVMFNYSCSGGGGQGSGSDYTPPETNTDVPFSIDLSPNKQVGETNAAIYMTALVLDQNGDPIDSTTVKFLETTGVANLSSSDSKDLGSANVSGVSKRKTSVYETKTNGYGQAMVKVSSTSSGFVSVEAYAGDGLMEKRTVYFGPSGGSTFSPMYVDVELDGNNNGTYDELDDYKVCQSSGDDTVDVRVTTYYKGAVISNINVFVLTDVASLVEFPNNLYALYSSGAGNKVLLGCDYDGDGVVESSCDYNGVVVQDMVVTDSLGQAYTKFTVDCQLISQQRLINVMATTAVYTPEEFNNAQVYGTGGTSLYLQPVDIKAVKITADPATVAVGETSYIEVTVDTNLGAATAPDGTVVQLNVQCKDRTDWSLTNGLTTLQTTNGKVSTLFTAPSTIPIDETCTITATAGKESSSIQLTITQALEILPATRTIDPLTETTTSFTIQGGTKPYEVSADKPDYVNLSLSGSTLTVTSIKVPTANETVTITVEDAKHTKVTATVTIIAPASAITLSAVGSSTLTNPEIGDYVQFTIDGGVPPYTATSSSEYVSASIADNILTVTVTQVPDKTVYAAITVKDSEGNKSVAVVTINISTADLTVTAITETTIVDPQVGDTVQFLVAGGTEPYSFSTSSNLIELSMTDSVLFATVKTVPESDTTIAITVTDSAGTKAVATINLDVAGATDLSVTVVGSNALTDPAIGDIVQFIISGGTAPYTAKSSSNLITTSIDDNVLTATVQGLPGNTATIAITVTDAAGTQIVTQVSITISPENVTSLSISAIGGESIVDPKVGDVLYYRVQNGVKPYTVISSSSLVTTSVSGEIVTATVAEQPDRTTELALVASDASGSVAVARMTLSLTSDVNPNLSIIPSELTIYNDVTRTIEFTVTHGKAPYQIISNSPTVAYNGTAGNHTWDVTTDPGTFTVDFGSLDNTVAQTVTLTVIDSYGATTTASISILAGSP